MQITIRDILKAQGSLATMVTKELPVVASFKLKRLVQKLNEEMQVFSEKRNELITKYGEEVEGKTKVIDDNIEVFKKDMEDLLDISLDLKVDPIAITEFGNDTRVSAEDLLQADKFIVG